MLKGYRLMDVLRWDVRLGQLFISRLRWRAGSVSVRIGFPICFAAVHLAPALARRLTHYLPLQVPLQVLSAGIPSDVFLAE